MTDVQSKIIEPFPNYLIYEDGRVENIKTGRILKSRIRSRYLCITLSNNKVKKDYLVHRLVALAFIPNPENKATVNHIDGDRFNNHKSNLEWNTHQENNLHAYTIGLRDYKRFVWTHPEHGEFTLSSVELARQFKGISKGHLSSVSSGKLNHHKNWKLKET